MGTEAQDRGLEQLGPDLMGDEAEQVSVVCRQRAHLGLGPGPTRSH